jgi:hypothetical protein
MPNISFERVHLQAPEARNFSNYSIQLMSNTHRRSTQPTHCSPAGNGDVLDTVLRRSRRV